MTQSASRPRPAGNGSASERVIRVVQVAGGALTVALALALIVLVALVALPLVPGADRVTVATGAFTAIGTISGAYFGHRLGSDGRQKAEEERQESERTLELVAAKAGETTVKQARDEVRRERDDPGSPA